MKDRPDILQRNLTRYLDENPITGSVFMVDDFLTIATDDLTYWHTRFHNTHDAMPTPHYGKKYDAIFMRLPKSHEYFDYILRCTLPLLSETSTLYVYGLNDEGIKGAQKKLEGFYTSVEPALIKNKGRIIACSSKKDITLASPQPQLIDFAQQHEIRYDDQSYPMTYYPGMFASGELDEGTKLLLDTALPLLGKQKNILDYASGSGIIARVLHNTLPQAAYDLLDNDTISLAASKVNIADANHYILGDTLAACSAHAQYDMVISNPPIHTGKSHQRDTLFSLIRDSQKYLRPKGRLILVTQAHIPLDDIFSENFTAHSVLAETTRFKIWEGRL